MKQLFYKEHLIENESVRIAENLEKFLHFGGKRYSCRSPPDFR